MTSIKVVFLLKRMGTLSRHYKTSGPHLKGSLLIYLNPRAQTQWPDPESLVTPYQSTLGDPRQPKVEACDRRHWGQGWEGFRPPL